MFKNKKGVSAVVANVLIILLVVVGIGLLWAAVRPQIETTAEQIETSCLKVSMAPVRCTVTMTCSVAGESCTGKRIGDACGAGTCNAISAVATAITTRNAGGGQGTVKGAKFLFDGSNGRTIYDYTTNIDELASALIPSPVSITSSTDVTFNIAPVLSTGDTCDALSSEVTCVGA
jgi:hypothetical protein